MKNKSLAFLGIIAYILSVVSSAEDLAGNPTAPSFLIIISTIVLFIFVVFASKRLWRENRNLVLVFVISFVVRTLFEILITMGTLADGSSLIMVFSLSKVVYLISYIIIVVKLFKKNTATTSTEIA